MDKKKDKHNYPKLPSEKSVSEIREHKELVHEDKDPIYPFDPVKDENGKTIYLKNTKKKET